ncbi:type VI secretion system baseplate subunit TssE [Bartonella sp. HY329]|uniref:type VI secretion system baseplate subunit TssE n=1 Tax=unclassified Bartonella TaxID=2645622 RepID=UPI0021C7B9A8|nr:MULTISPECIES: type VI secretion system baseplate subunit TssE [unclassified Bartonella]UXM95237.1 type VI secretion system baseplate subunit TssE [Bartonella sp. HY329]UXN09561.1 type VI secretion system baseplate subunit TssE [Bartonella sp. HY328]
MKLYSSSRKKSSGTPDNQVIDTKTRLASGSLLDRLIADDEDLPQPHYSYEIDGIIRSIKKNLNRALNIHAGGALSNMNLGIPDFNHSTVSSFEVSMQLIDSIRKCIGSAEPRIFNIEVKSQSDIDSPLELNFYITAMLKIARHEEQIRIDIAMRDGHFYSS